jgi:hypothetical protein
MRLGKNELSALKFAHKYKGWVTYSRDSKSIKTIFSLAKKKLIEHKAGQYKITKLGNAYIWDHTDKFYL